MNKQQLLGGGGAREFSPLKGKNVWGEGFTLAEVLITLGIIGVVAAMTMPTLIAKHQKQETISRLQKAYSIFNQAMKRSELDNGEYDIWPKGKDIVVENYFNTYFKPYYKGVKLCENAKDCGYTRAGENSNPWKNINGTPIAWGLKTEDSRFLFQIADGTVIFMPRYTRDADGNPSYYSSGNVYIDLNGGGNPNVLGKDVFLFKLASKKGLIPYCSDMTDDEVIANCTTSSSGNENCCTDKIIRDGWQIKDDYPW